MADIRKVATAVTLPGLKHRKLAQIDISAQMRDLLALSEVEIGRASCRERV